MALFEITPELQEAGKPVTPGKHVLELTSITDKNADNGDKKTTIAHKVVDGKDKGKMVFVNLNHNDNDSIQRAMPYILFQLDYPKFDSTKTAKVELTVANAKHKQFEAEITNSESNGTIYSNMKKFYALKRAGTTAPAKA